MKRAKKTDAMLTKMEKNLIGEGRRVPEKRLKEKVKLLRNLRDKYRGLAREQKRSLRGRSAGAVDTVSTGKSRTVMKAELFARELEKHQESLARRLERSES
jgi:hypothetical protein